MATIQGIYVALFGRPADPLGLAYFNEVTNDGADLTAIGDLAATAEYQDRFEGMNNSQIVTAIYQSLFGRNPELAGLEFFVNALNSGDLNINNVAIAILDGAQGADAEIVANKVAAAEAFTSAIAEDADLLAAYSGESGANAGRAYISPITADEDSIPTEAELEAYLATLVDENPSGGEGKTFTLTAAADYLAPDAAEAKFVTTAGDDTFRALTAGDLSTADVIDGGKGVDTLNAVVNNIANNPVLKSVEIVNLTTGNVASQFNASSSTGIEQLWFKSAGAAGDDLTLTGVALSTVVGLSAGAGSDLSVTFVGNTGAADTANLVVAGTNGVFTANGIETLNIDASTSASALTVNGDKTETVDVSGSKNVSLTIGAAADDNLKVIDASDSTGNFTLNALAEVNALTFTGSSGNNFVSLTGGKDNSVTTAGGNDNVTTGAGKNTISTGAGNDSITLGGTGADTVDAGAGNDHVYVYGAASKSVITLGEGADVAYFQGATGVASSNAVNTVTITDFVSGTDKINVDANGATAVTSQANLNTIQVAVDGLAGTATLVDALNAAANVTALNEASYFTFKGDTYVYVEQTAAVTYTAGDLVVKVVGADAVAIGDIIV